MKYSLKHTLRKQLLKILFDICYIHGNWLALTILLSHSGAAFTGIEACKASDCLVIRLSYRLLRVNDDILELSVESLIKLTMFAIVMLDFEYFYDVTKCRLSFLLLLECLLCIIIVTSAARALILSEYCKKYAITAFLLYLSLAHSRHQIGERSFPRRKVQLN